MDQKNMTNYAKPAITDTLTPRSHWQKNAKEMKESFKMEMEKFQSYASRSTVQYLYASVVLFSIGPSRQLG